MLRSDDSFSNLQISYVSFTYYLTFGIQFFMRNFESVYKDDVPNTCSYLFNDSFLGLFAQVSLRS